MKADLQSAFNVVVKYGFCSDCRWRLNSKECRACDCYQNGVILIQNAMEKASAGAASVVHCENCQYYELLGDAILTDAVRGICTYRPMAYGVKDNDFCSYGERKEGAEIQ